MSTKRILTDAEKEQIDKLRGSGMSKKNIRNIIKCEQPLIDEYLDKKKVLTPWEKKKKEQEETQIPQPYVFDDSKPSASPNYQRYRFIR